MWLTGIAPSVFPVLTDRLQKAQPMPLPLRSKLPLSMLICALLACAAPSQAEEHPKNWTTALSTPQRIFFTTCVIKTSDFDKNDFNVGDVLVGL
jgi:hypothetical protein